MKRDTSLRRRHFLQGAASITTGLALPTFVPATVFGAQAPSNRIAMGAIGVGSQGTRDMRGFLNKSGSAHRSRPATSKSCKRDLLTVWNWSIHELSVEFV